MKRLNIATLVAVMAISAPYAQSMVEDVDGDGVYSKEELMVVYPAITEDIFSTIDTNADGSVDAEELWVAFVEGGHSGEGVAAFGDAQVEGAFGFGELLLFESQSVGFRVWEFWEGSL